MQTIEITPPREIDGTPTQVAKKAAGQLEDVLHAVAVLAQQTETQVRNAFRDANPRLDEAEWGFATVGRLSEGTVASVRAATRRSEYLRRRVEEPGGLRQDIAQESV